VPTGVRWCTFGATAVLADASARHGWRSGGHEKSRAASRTSPRFTYKTHGGGKIRNLLL